MTAPVSVSCSKQTKSLTQTGLRSISGIGTDRRASRHRSAAGSKGERCRKDSSCTFPNHKLKTLKGFSNLSRLIPGRFVAHGEGSRPIDERLHRRTERFPKLGEFIFHLWWKLRMNGSLHQLALLKETQLLRQHRLRNAGDGAFKLRESPDRAREEPVQNNDLPFAIEN